MVDAPIPANDDLRVRELCSLAILDTPPEERFDRIVASARNLLDVPIALVSLVDRERQWFKASAGLDATETTRRISFCGHAILDDGLMEICDASADERFVDNPLVTGELGLRFYAGMPLFSPRGYALGTLCLIDRRPRQLSAAQHTILRDLAAWAESELNARELDAANQQVTRQSRQLRTLLDNVTDAIIVLDDHCLISSVNAACEKMFASSMVNLRGQPLARLIAGAALQRIEVAARKLRRPGASDRLSVADEISLQRADGTHFIADLRLSIDLEDAEYRFMIIVRDITESHMAFECLEAMNRKLAESLGLQQAILDGVNHAIVACRLDGLIVMFNAGAERMLGYQARELLFTKTPLVFHDPVQIDERARQMSETLGRPVRGMEVFLSHVSAGGIDEQEWTFVRRDRSTLPVMLSLSSLRDDSGNITGSIGIAHDLTETKRLEAMKSDFVATVSHELRTPLTSIKGAVQIMAAASVALPPTFQKLLEIAEKNCLRLASMINDILDLEKLGCHKMHFDCQYQSMAPVVRDAVRSVQPYAEKFGVSVHCQASGPDAAFGCVIDGDRIMQVIVNLLSNAIKYSPRGATVDAMLSVSERQVRLVVSDHGPGIPLDFHGQVFEKFAQAGNSTSRGQGGSGLGLAICKAIIDHHGGTIGFDSVPGQGSAFYFCLASAEALAPATDASAG